MDNELEHFHLSPPHKSYNPFESDDETIDTRGTELEDVCSKEDHIGFDLREFEQSANPLSFLMDNDDSLWEETVINEHCLNATESGQSSSFEKDCQSYTDKNVTECELPEPVISKDIAVDEGAHSQERKDASNFQDLSRQVEDTMKVEKVSSEIDVLEAPRPEFSSDLQKDGALLANEDLSMDRLNRDVKIGQHMVNEFEEDDSQKITDRKLDLEEQVSFPVDWEMTTGEVSPSGLAYNLADSIPAAGVGPSNNASEKCEPDSVYKDEADHEDSLVKKASNNFRDKGESILVQDPATGETLLKRSTEQGQPKIIPDEIQSEEQTLPNSGNSITFGFNSSTHSDPIKQENIPQTAEPTNPLPQSSARHEQPTSSHSVSTGVPIHHQPSSVTFSSPVAYSGSISIRSESSTGSTRSFAFPVLQNEWKSSPVRMANSERRRRKKYRGWLQALMCCRF